MRSFQRCLGYCTRIWWQFLHTFADAFQGCYKNGTNGSRDYRYFAGLYLLFRAVLLVGFIAQPSTFRWLILIPFPAVISLLFASFRPYKNNYFNIIDCLAVALGALSTFLIMYTYTTHVHYYIHLLYAVLLTPFLYFVSFILYKILSQVALFHSCCSRILISYTTVVLDLCDVARYVSDKKLCVPTNCTIKPFCTLFTDSCTLKTPFLLICETHNEGMIQILTATTIDAHCVCAVHLCFHSLLHTSCWFS